MFKLSLIEEKSMINLIDLQIFLIYIDVNRLTIHSIKYLTRGPLNKPRIQGSVFNHLNHKGSQVTHAWMSKETGSATCIESDESARHRITLHHTLLLVLPPRKAPIKNKQTNNRKAFAGL